MQTSFYLTEDDNRSLRMVALNAGFKSTSQLMTFITERLLRENFHPLAFAKTGWQVSSHADKFAGGFQGGFDFGALIRPGPPLPEYDMPASEWRRMIEQLKKEERGQQEREKSARPKLAKKGK